MLIARRRTPKNDDFVIDWHKVEVTDKVLKRLAEYMELTDDEAFDRSLDILECSAEFRVDVRWTYRELLKKRFRGNWVHAQWNTFENLQIGVENNRWTRLFYSNKYVYLPETLKQEIYSAEDGRCELCGQAMHFRVAHFVKRDWTAFGRPENIALACYCCASNRKNVLFHPDLIIMDDNMEYLREGMGKSSIEEVKDFLKQSFRYAVHTNTFSPYKPKGRAPQVRAAKMRGQYWLPGIGRFRLVYEDQETRVFKVQFTEVAKAPALRIQPQKSSRGLAQLADN